MRKGQASTTAKVVAYWRMLGDMGMTNVPGFSDPVARAMLSGRRWQRAIAHADKLARDPQHRTRVGMTPFIDMMILRVAFIDAVIAEQRPAQVVILGAGLDTRAYRLPALRGVRVIEVDHPDTQAYKQERVAALAADHGAGTPLAQLSFAPLDFTRREPAQLAAALARAGFDARTPTLWIWEGVIMYLDNVALRDTLGELRQLSAPGSTLIAHYHEPNPPTLRNALRMVVLTALREPQKGLRNRHEMRKEIERAGFRVQQDAGVPEQAARFGIRTPNKPDLHVSRIIVASVL